TLIDKSVSYLEKNNIKEAKLKTEIIFSHVLNIDRMMLFTKYRDIPDSEKTDKIRSFIQKVGKEKFPVQYLLNEQEFYGRKFYVDKGVLIPRQDTEILAEEAVKILKGNKVNKPKILDIGTGSGIIGITLALEIKGSKVMGIDISDKALEISEKNKILLNAENIKFLKSDLFENVEYKNFNMIISNPPYISGEEISVMSEDTLLHEPDEALFASNEGLYFYSEISRKSMEHLENKGYLLFETGYGQSEKVKKIMEKSGYGNVNIIKDMQNISRVVTGQKI
ncbi:MAG: peptide chain release factor N(5)-glutamine methyltransferase, partial [Leptotrichiaceae bacterium]|nr:peptide chain release factor N(5)-glutamine methyltransferase [Leptotrichiaceae bacterium]